MNPQLIEHHAITLNKALREINPQKIYNILSLPEIQRILKHEDDSKYTPLFWACSSLSQNLALEIVPKMLQKGADPYKLDNYSQNVLYYIAKAGKDRLLNYMIQNHQYELNTNDQTKQTPLFFAAAQGHVKCADVLLQNGANINHIDMNGQNCLFWAAGGGHLEMCKFLVNKGVDSSLLDTNRNTAFHYAKKNKHSQVMYFLQEIKNNQKKNKQAYKMESSQQQSRQPPPVAAQVAPRKKKQLLRQKYCLIYTSDKGEVHQLTMQQIQKFAQANDKNQAIIQFLQHPEKLDNYPMPEQKKYQKIANKILTHFMKHEQGPIFLFPVDYVTLNIPTYPTIIKHPMDFTTIKTKLAYNAYENQKDFHYDMNLVFDNCVTFNGADSAYGKIATQMKLEFKTMYIKQFGM